MLIQIIEIKKLIENIFLPSQEGKLAAFQEGNNGIDWFLVCLCKFRKAKSYFNNYWVVIVKNEYGLLSVETLRFFAWWYKFRKAKSYFNNCWVGMVKNERDLLDHGTLKLGVSHKWLDELISLTKWFFHVDFSDGIIIPSLKSTCKNHSVKLFNQFDCQSTLYLWHLNAWG